MLFKHKRRLVHKAERAEATWWPGRTGLPGWAFRGEFACDFMLSVKRSELGLSGLKSTHTHTCMRRLSPSSSLRGAEWMHLTAAVENVGLAHTRKTMNLSFHFFCFETLHSKYLLRNIFLFSSCSDEKSWHLKAGHSVYPWPKCSAVFLSWCPLTGEVETCISTREHFH